MLGKIRNVVVNNLLLKVASLNAVSVAIQMVGGLVISKLIAIYLGERGMALLGYLRNFLTSTQSVATLGFTNGVVTYVASNDEGDTSPKNIISTSIIACFIISVAIAMILFFGANYWDALLFNQTQSYAVVFKYLAIALPFISLNLILISIINGNSEYARVVHINIISNLLSLAITAYLIITKATLGALLAIVLVPGFAFIVTLLFLLVKRDFTIFPKTEHFNLGALRSLGSYSIMAIFSMVILPFVYIAIRDEIAVNAGYWDAMTRISDFYLRFVSTLMTLYILPQLAKTDNLVGFRKEIFSFYKTILPLLAAGMIVLFLLRNIVLKVLYTEEFLPVASLFKWQLLGDFFKVASIVIGYQIIAKNNLKLFLITEVISLLVIYLSGVFFVRNFGYEGAAMGHCLSYGFHLLLLLFIFRKPLFGKITELSE